MKKAFISASNKTGLLSLVHAFLHHEIQLIASEGTANYLREKDIEIQSIEDFLGIKPMLDGRVKTLHPRIFGGILADRSNTTHLEDLAINQIELIDYVIVDLYPFDEYQDIEHIDIGGVALMRAAAKNYQYCTVISEKSDYELLIDELTAQAGSTRLDFRRAMAAKAFLSSSAYDAKIANWVSNDATKSWSLTKTLNLSYGENPHQSAGFYQPTQEAPNLRFIQGKPLSFNNILDLDAGIKLITEFKEPASAVIKHTNPCGIALGETALDAVKRAFYADMKSAFGGIVVLNQAVNVDVALFLNQHFIEIIAAPAFSEEALTQLLNKPKCRVIQFYPEKMPQIEIKSALNGFLLQVVDHHLMTTENVHIPTMTKPSTHAIADLNFAFQTVRYVKSNAIVIAKSGVTLAIGSGQTNRVDAVRIALYNAQGQDLNGAVLASDGFFPFADSIEQIANTPIKAIIQPGGSLRDDEVIRACDRYGISMMMTNKRGFKH